MRADLHVHSDHSGLKHLRFLRMRDCYSAPLDVYRCARSRGMDFVTLTDHDTIDGCLEIRDRLSDPPDFFMSEEVETFLPGDRSMHIGVFGITETQHREIQRLRRDFDSLVAYLAEQRIVASLNHLFRGYRPGLDVETYLAPLVRRFDLFETKNGTQSARYRLMTERAIASFRPAKRARPGRTAGSDAHTLARVGRTWTECPGTDRESFLENLRAGRGTVAGDDGRLFPLAGDVYSVVLSYYAQLLGLGRVRFAPGERWPGALFCLGTLPAHLIAFPFLATSWNLILKRLGLERIEARLGEPRSAPPDLEVPAEAEI
jgi:predicted metal-dependent phosphoesterase TrpH